MQLQFDGFNDERQRFGSGSQKFNLKIFRWGNHYQHPYPFSNMVNPNFSKNSTSRNCCSRHDKRKKHLIRWLKWNGGQLTNKSTRKLLIESELWVLWSLTSTNLLVYAKSDKHNEQNPREKKDKSKRKSAQFIFSCHCHMIIERTMRDRRQLVGFPSHSKNILFRPQVEILATVTIYA